MKNKTYFIMSIAFSLILPLLIAVFYLNDVLDSSSDDIEIAAEPEIIYSRGESISDLNAIGIEDEDYRDANVYEFSISYHDGKVDPYIYSIRLKDVKISEEIDKSKLKWVLEKYDSDSREYDIITSGNLDILDGDAARISSNLIIKNEEKQDFRLYYYLSSDKNENYGGGNFTAKLYLEREFV